MQKSVTALSNPFAHKKQGQENNAALLLEAISLHYQPGKHLEEAVLVDELAIGRTSVREALQRLSADLLVASQPGKGLVHYASKHEGCICCTTNF